MAFVFPEGLVPEIYPLAWLVGVWHGQGNLVYPNIEQSAMVQEVTFTHDGGPYLAYRATTRLVDQNGQTGPVWHTESGYWRVVPADPASVTEQSAARGQQAGASHLVSKGQSVGVDQPTRPGQLDIPVPAGEPGTGNHDPAGHPSGQETSPDDETTPSGSGNSPQRPVPPPIARDIEVLLADPAGAVSIYMGQVEGPRIAIATDLMAHTLSGAEMNAGRRLYGLVESDLLWAWDLAAFGQPLQSYMSARLERVEESGS